MINNTPNITVAALVVTYVVPGLYGCGFESSRRPFWVKPFYVNIFCFYFYDCVIFIFLIFYYVLKKLFKNYLIFFLFLDIYIYIYIYFLMFDNFKNLFFWFVFNITFYDLFSWWYLIKKHSLSIKFIKYIIYYNNEHVSSVSKLK